ncbi:hypothetical protein ACLOJK_023188 [Asimina triloba]
MEDEILLFSLEGSGGRGVVLILGVPNWWRERLPDIVETASVELETSQRVVLEFFHSHSLKWFSSKEIFFWWCQGLTFFGALVAFTQGEADVHRSAIREGQGPVMLQEEEEERLTRREEVDLHAALDLSREEVGCFGLAVSLAEPANSRPVALIDSMPAKSVHVVDVNFWERAFRSSIEGRQRAATVRGFLTSQHQGRDKASRRPQGIENSCRNMSATPTPVSRRVFGATLGETSSCSADEEIFRCPFDIEARALKILSNLIPVLTWETAVGLLKDLDASKFEQELAKEIATKLLAELDAAKAELDEALDDAKGVILAKRDLERALKEATAEIVRLQAKLEAPRAEPAQLRSDSSEGAEGEASGQASGPLSGEYLRSDAHRQREEFERTHYAHGGFVKALLEDAVLYPKLDLSSLYGSS